MHLRNIGKGGVANPHGALLMFLNRMNVILVTFLIRIS